MCFSISQAKHKYLRIGDLMKLCVRRHLFSIYCMDGVFSVSTFVKVSKFSTMGKVSEQRNLFFCLFKNSKVMFINNLKITIIGKLVWKKRNKTLFLITACPSMFCSFTVIVV